MSREILQTAAAANATPKVGRNDPCPCGSGRKYKNCCLGREEGADRRSISSPPSPAPRQKLIELSLAAKQHGRAGRWIEAIVALRELVRQMPDSPEAHCDLGVACLASGRPDEAAANLQRAVGLRPGLDVALRHLAHAFLQLGRESDALAAYHKLSRTAGDALERRHYLAKALAIDGKPEEAEKELRQLLALAPQHAEARMLLGELLSERGMLDEAAQHLTQAVEILPAAFQQLTAVKRMTEADRPLIDRLRVLVERLGVDLGPRVRVHFGLGKAFDDLGDHAGAMRQYDAGNRLRATAERLDRAALAARYDRIIADFTAEALARRGMSSAGPASTVGDLPVFILGMPRSGTTLVEQILSSHPAVAAGGELPFWTDQRRRWDSSRIDAFDAGTLSNAATDYFGQLRQIGPQALRVTDKRPRNFEALGPIRLALPNARVIHCRRNAIDTCLSIFFTNFGGRLDYAWDRGDLVFAYRQYERLMDHWRRVLSADRFTEVEYETLVADQETETRRLVAFCGLDWNNACLAPERNARIVRTASLGQVRQPVYAKSVERWRRYEPWLGELRALLPAEEAQVS